MNAFELKRLQVWPVPYWSIKFACSTPIIFEVPGDIQVSMAAVILERSGVDDLILLDEIEESKVLDVLKSRYLDEDIYTYIGKCIAEFGFMPANVSQAVLMHV